ncbi:hypothetical protein ACE6H2_026501 [Prunus campanulata]
MDSINFLTRIRALEQESKINFLSRWPQEVIWWQLKFSSMLTMKNQVGGFG